MIGGNIGECSPAWEPHVFVVMLGSNFFYGHLIGQEEKYLEGL